MICGRINRKYNTRNQCEYPAWDTGNNREKYSKTNFVKQKTKELTTNRFANKKQGPSSDTLLPVTVIFADEFTVGSLYQRVVQMKTGDFRAFFMRITDCSFRCTPPNKDNLLDSF